MDIEFCAPFQTSLDVVEIENRLPSIKCRFSASCVISAEFSRCDCRRGAATDPPGQQAVPGRHGAQRALPDRHRQPVHQFAHLVSSDFLLKKLKSEVSVNAITRAIEGKADRASGALVQADLSESDMASIAARTRGKPSAQSVDTLFLPQSNGIIVRFNRLNSGG